MAPNLPQRFIGGSPLHAYFPSAGSRWCSSQWFPLILVPGPSLHSPLTRARERQASAATWPSTPLILSHGPHLVYHHANYSTPPCWRSPHDSPIFSRECLGHVPLTFCAQRVFAVVVALGARVHYTSLCVLSLCRSALILTNLWLLYTCFDSRAGIPLHWKILDFVSIWAVLLFLFVSYWAFVSSLSASSSLVYDLLSVPSSCLGWRPFLRGVRSLYSTGAP